jgi:anaerobic selenocysteine-containing dehydrogenase
MGDLKVFRTVCPRNCYCTCGMLVHVRDGRIVRIEGDALNPATEGKVCLKGISYARRIAAPDRLLHPLCRKPHGTGFEEIPWEDALNDISEKLQRLRSDLGPASILYYEASGSHGALSTLADAFWNPFGGPTRTHGDLCWPAGLEATRLTYGANLHNHPRLALESRFILLWGHNPAETNIHQMRINLKAQERGATLAVIDPRSTDTSDAADYHLQPRPGTDAALALGLAHIIVEKNLHAADFLSRVGTGVESYLERLREYPPDRTSKITGVSAQAIEELAIAYAQKRPALVIAGFGLQRHHQAGQTIRAVSLLPALTGNVGLPGGGWQYANLASHCLRPPPLPPSPAGIMRTFPTARIGKEIMTLKDPPIRAAWFDKANPASQHPRTGSVIRALGKLDLVVVVDQFLTDTAKLAHYILPAKSMFEEEDLVTAYWHPYLQLRTRIFEPPGSVKTETEIWRVLCERFGFDTCYFPQNPRETLRAMLPESGQDLLEQLERGPVDPSDGGEIVWADGRFPTPSGRIEFASEEAARLWGVDPVPKYTPLEEGHESALARRFPLQLLTCKTRERIHSQFGNLDWIRREERPRCLEIHPDDAQRRDLENGEAARVWNDRGEVHLRVRHNPGIRPGVVHVIEGRCTPDDPQMNLLTDDGVTDMNHGATFYECLVEVEKS